MTKILCWLALMAKLAIFLLLFNLGFVFSYTCNGISSSDKTRVCSGHGYCTIQDTCLCYPGYQGIYCSLKTEDPFSNYVFVNGKNFVNVDSSCSLKVSASVSSIGLLTPNQFISENGGSIHYGDSISTSLHSSAMKSYSQYMDAPCDFNILDSNLSQLEVEGGNVYCFENGWFAAQTNEHVHPTLIVKGDGEHVVLKFPNNEGRLIIDHLDVQLNGHASFDNLVFVAKSSEIRGGVFKGRLFSSEVTSIIDTHIEGKLFVLGSSASSKTTFLKSVSFAPILERASRRRFNERKISACSKETTCSNHGECDATDSCVCYSNANEGYWTGASCNTCKNGYYGEKCATTASGPATITDDYRGITFNFFSPSSFIGLEISCSKVLHPSDLSGGLYGTSENVRCFYLDRSTSRFLIKFGSVDYSLQSGVSNLRINANAFDNSTSNTITYLSFVINPPSTIATPVASIKMPSVDIFSSCDSIIVDGSQSYSVDGKDLTYSWALVDSSSLSVISNSYANSALITLPSSLAAGSYKMRLQVRSSYLNKDSIVVYSNTFAKSTKVLPILKVAKDLYTITRYTQQFPLLINKIVEHSSCRSNVDSIVVEWAQLSGPAVETSVNSYNDLYIAKLTTFGSNTYTFKVSAYYASDQSTKTSSVITLNTQSPDLSLSLMKYEAKSDYTTVQVDYSDPETIFNTLSVDTWTWSCSNNNSPRLLTLLSAISNTKKTYFTVSTSLFDTIPKSIDISLQIVKSDMRTVTKGITIYFQTVPPVVNFVTIEPKATIIAPGKSLVAQILVTSFSEKTNSTWSLNGEAFYYGTIQTGNSQTVKVDSSKLAEGSSNVLTVLVNDYTINESTQLTYNFQVGTSPKICNCNVSPTSGNAMESEFIFSCLNCKTSTNIDFRFGYVDDRANLKVSLYNQGNFFSTKLPGPTLSNKVTVFFEIIDTTTEAMTTISKDITVTLPTVASNVTLALEKSQAWNSLSGSYLASSAFGKSFYQSASTSKIGSVLLNSALNGLDLLSTAKECTNGVTTSSGVCKCSDGYVGGYCDVRVTEYDNIQSDKTSLLNSMNQVFNGTKVVVDQDYIVMITVAIDALTTNYPYLSNTTLSSALSTLDKFLDDALSLTDLGISIELYNLFVKCIHNVYQYISQRNGVGYSNGIKIFRIMKKFSLLRGRLTNVNFPEYVRGSFYHSTVGKSTLYNFPSTVQQFESSTSISASLFTAQTTIITKPFVHAMIVSDDVIGLNKKLNTPLKTSLPSTYKLSSAISPIVSLALTDSSIAVSGNSIDYIIPVNTTNIVHDLTQQSFSYVVQSRVFYCANFDDSGSTLAVLSNCTYTSLNSSFVKCKCNHLTNVFVMETTTVTYVSYIIIICVAGGILLVCCVLTITFICVAVCCCYYKKKYQKDVVVKKKVVYVGKRMKDGTIMLVAKAVDTDIEMLEKNGGKKVTTTTTTKTTANASDSEYASKSSMFEGVARQTTSAHAYRKEGGTYVSSEEMRSQMVTESKEGQAVVNYEHMRSMADIKDTGSYRTLTSRSNSEEDRSRGSSYKGSQHEHSSSHGSRKAIQYSRDQHEHVPFTKSHSAHARGYEYHETLDEMNQEETTLDDYHNEEFNEYSRNVANSNAHYYTNKSNTYGSRNQSSKSSRTGSPFSSKGSREKNELVAVSSAQNKINSQSGGYSNSYSTYETTRTYTDENGQTRTEVVRGVNDNGKVNVERMFTQNGHSEVISGNGYDVSPNAFNTEKRITHASSTNHTGGFYSEEHQGDVVHEEYIEPSFIVEEQEVTNHSKNTVPIVQEEFTATKKSTSDDYYAPAFLSELSEKEKESKCSSRRSYGSTRRSTGRVASSYGETQRFEQEAQFVVEEKVLEQPTEEVVVEDEKIVKQRNEYSPSPRIVQQEPSYIVEDEQQIVEEKIEEPVYIPKVVTSPKHHGPQHVVHPERLIEEPRYIPKVVSPPKPQKVIRKQTPQYVEEKEVEEHIEEPRFIRKDSPKYIVEREQEVVEESVEDQLFATEDYDEEKIVRSKNIHDTDNERIEKSNHSLHTSTNNVLSLPDHFTEDKLKGSRTRSSSYSSFESSKTFSDNNGTRTEIVKEVNDNGKISKEKKSSYDERIQSSHKNEEEQSYVVEEEKIVKQQPKFIPQETVVQEPEYIVEEEKVVKQKPQYIPEEKVIEQVVEEEKIVKKQPKIIPKEKVVKKVVQEPEYIVEEEKVVKQKPQFIPPKSKKPIKQRETKNEQENFMVEKKSKNNMYSDSSSYSTYETKRTFTDENGKTTTEVVKGVNNNGKVNVEKSTLVNGKTTNVERSEDYDESINKKAINNRSKNNIQSSSEHNIIKKETRRTITDEHGTRTEITIEINDNGKITTETKTIHHKNEQQNKNNGKINFYERKSKNNLLNQEANQERAQERIARVVNRGRNASPPGKIVKRTEAKPVKMANPSRSISAPETKKTKSEPQLIKKPSPKTEESKHVLTKAASNSKNEIKRKLEARKKNERAQKIKRSPEENARKSVETSTETKTVVKNSNDRNIDITKGANNMAVKLEARTVENEQVVNNKSGQNNNYSYETVKTTTVTDNNGSRSEIVKTVNDNGKVNVEKTVIHNQASVSDMKNINQQQEGYYEKVVNNSSSYVNNSNDQASRERVVEVVNKSSAPPITSQPLNGPPPVHHQPSVPVIPKQIFTQPVPVLPVNPPQPVISQYVNPQPIPERVVNNNSSYMTEEYYENREAYRMQDQYMHEQQGNVSSYSNQTDASYIITDNNKKNDIVYYNDRFIVPERNNVTGHPNNANLRVESVNAMNENRMKNSSSEIDHSNYGKSTTGTYETTYKTYYKNDEQPNPSNPSNPSGPVWRVDGDYVGISNKSAAVVERVVENRQRNEFAQSSYETPPRNVQVNSYESPPRFEPPQPVYEPPRFESVQPRPEVVRPTVQVLVENPNKAKVASTYVARNEVAENRLKNVSSEIDYSGYGKASTVGIYETTYKTYFNEGSQEPVVRPDLPNTLNIGMNNKITSTQMSSAYQSNQVSTNQAASQANNLRVNNSYVETRSNVTQATNQATSQANNLRVNNSYVETRNNAFSESRNNVETRNNNSYIETRTNYASNPYPVGDGGAYNNYPPTVEPANNRAYPRGEIKPKPERFPVGQLPREPYVNNGQISDDPMLHHSNIVKHKDGGYYIKVQIKEDAGKKSVFVVPTEQESKRRVNPIPLQMVDIYSINENQAQQVKLQEQ